MDTFLLYSSFDYHYGITYQATYRIYYTRAMDQPLGPQSILWLCASIKCERHKKMQYQNTLKTLSISFGSLFMYEVALWYEYLYMGSWRTLEINKLYCLRINRNISIVFNVYKSGTLLSAARERHSLNWERRRSATPFYQQERCGSGPHIFEESDTMSGPLLPLLFFWVSFFSEVHFYLWNNLYFIRVHL